jgi:hypothetical protein
MTQLDLCSATIDIERLMQRGLIRRDPDFQVANHSFARFVLTAESRDTQKLLTLSLRK